MWGASIKASPLFEFIFRIYLIGLGLIVRSNGMENFEHSKGRTKIIVSNHISELDLAPLRLLFGPLEPVLPSYYRKLILTKRAIASMNPIYMDRDRELVRQEIQQRVARTHFAPILCFPEGALTSGEEGLLLYHQFLFSLGEPVLPVVVRGQRPFPVHFDTLCTPVWHNLIWYMIIPFQVWHVDVLPLQHPCAGESGTEFATRVQRLTAAALGIAPTPYSVSHKRALVLERMPELRRRARIRKLIRNCISLPKLRRRKQGKQE
mmetsp:Transcript_29863/g.75135  ORF Transcript_29863/g.75135 Transcript_29863/m.75135 type:complete len:263 (+) Transcript_29863:104-892(+)